ncbi:class I SAM-dependent methyltransferase [Clostridium sp.]|uniref:class I SAM-dependent methyltransferase n=1 Tax=Clostridium sp. TaxID=1506 RepID=UPI00262B7046|nr:class I SAM-dependent methyltransferase [Clostridium sp.]
MSNKCRVCGKKLYKEPLLQYYNMPNRAQFFVEESELNEDKGIDLFLYQCSGCGLLQLNVEPVSYYKDVIRAAGVSDEMKSYRLKHFSDFVNRYNLKNKKVIEIGTGSGEFLELMNKTDAKAYGLEHLDESVNTCLEKKLDVYKGFIEDENYEIENAPYDAFFIMNFLEHIPNPNEFLQGITNNLKDNAIGLIEVPNVDMILEKAMFSEFISDHLMYFTKDTLKFLLEKNGFEVVEIQEVWHDYVISMIVKKRNKLVLNEFNKQLSFISNQINLFIDKNIEKGFKVAVWGAGHQSLAVMAMTNIAPKIQFVIDSAPFKQGKYTPATHAKVVSPSILKEVKIGAILVMAASYSDEVARIINRDYPEIIIAILRDDKLEMKNSTKCDFLE